MKTLLVALTLSLTLNAYANQKVTKNLSASDSEIALSLAKKYNIPFIGFGGCVGRSFTVTLTQTGMDGRDYYRIETSDSSYAVKSIDIESIDRLFNSLEVPGNRTDYTTFQKDLDLSSLSCVHQVTEWTGTYEIFGPDWK